MSTIKGVWVFNDSLSLREFNQSVNFTSNGKSYFKMSLFNYDAAEYTLEYDYSGNSDNDDAWFSPNAGSTQTWRNEAYKTVDFGSTEQDVSDTFLTWIQANATYQRTPTLTYDLNKLHLNDGTYSITVRANAEGYRSAVSNAVNYVLQHLTIDASVSGNILTISGMQSGVSKTITLYGETESDVLATITNVTASSTTYDLSTLGLSAGEHAIGVQASAEGYKNSAIVTVFYTVQAGYTVTVNIQAYGGGSGSGYYYDGYKEDVDYIDGHLRSGTNVLTITSGYLSLRADSDMSDADYSSTYEKVYSKVNTVIYKIDRDGSVNIITYPCFVEGTQISLADGSTKAVEDITMSDDLLVWDFYEGKQASAKPMWIMPKKEANYYFKVTLSDDTVLNLVGYKINGGSRSHRLYNVEQNAFLYPQDFAEGEHTINEYGELLTVMSIECVEETVNYYNIVTDTHYNLYAENILTSCRLSNRYGIVDMKYNKDDVRMTEDEVEAYIDNLDAV